ncbi:MAG: ABC transporter ATP-binding protein [bacterium]
MHSLFKEVSPYDWKADVHFFWGLTRKYIPRLFLAIVCSLLLSSINGAIAWLIKPSVDNLVVIKNKNYLVFVPVGILVLFTLRGFSAFANNFLIISIGSKIVKTLRMTLYEKLLALPLSFYTQKSTGSIISRLINDVGALESLAPNTARNFFIQPITIAVLAAVALYRNWQLALLSFTIIPLIALAADRFGRRMKRTSTRTRQLISNVTHILHESLQGIKVIKSFTMEPDMLRRNEHAVSEHYRNFMREVRINEFTGTIVEIIAGIGIAVLSWYGFSLIVNNKLTLGEFLSFVIAVMMMYDPLKRLTRSNNDFQVIRASLGRVREIFSLEEERPGRVEQAGISGRIVFKDVSFTYPELPEPVLHHIALEINPGETVALVGHSGAGKSTLADLILGFWDNYTGSITIDSIDLKDLALRSLRSHIGVVSQDIVLFDDTVKNNILYGKPGATDDEIIEAAKAAYAHEFIERMPQGYDTPIAERGVKLSGGQKQRISLARAIIKNPSILVLDEATSSLDTDSETKIQKALENIMPGRTTLVIAHRLSTVQKADRIIVLDKGRIVQQGTHVELASRQGIYKELYNLQFGSRKH